MRPIVEKSIFLMIGLVAVGICGPAVVVVRIYRAFRGKS